MHNKLNLSSCGKYSIGSTIWYLDFEHSNQAIIGEEYDAYYNCHPIFLFKKTPVKSIWKTNRVLPKLEHYSFDVVINILTGKLAAKSIVVDSVELDDTIGEFIYSDNAGEIYLPELIVFETNRDALRERSRILNMIKDCIIKQIGTNHDLFSMRKSSEKQQNKRSNNRTWSNDIKKSETTDSNAES